MKGIELRDCYTFAYFSEYTIGYFCTDSFYSLSLCVSLSFVFLALSVMEFVDVLFFSMFAQVRMQ